MQMSYLYPSDFPLKTFANSAQHAETIRKNVWQKSNDAYSLSVRVQSTINHIRFVSFYVFHHEDVSVKENVFFFFRARAEKGIARHIDASSVVGT